MYGECIFLMIFWGEGGVNVIEYDCYDLIKM